MLVVELGIPVGAWSTNLDLWVIRGDAESDEPVWNGKSLVHIYFGLWYPGHDSVRRVEAGGTGANNGYAEGRVRDRSSPGSGSR